MDFWVHLSPALESAVIALPRKLDALNDTLQAILEDMRLPWQLTGGAIAVPDLLLGGPTMYIVKDGEPAHNFNITPPSVTDAQGRPVPNAQLVYDVVTDDEVKVPVAYDPAANLLSGSVGPFADNDDGTPALVAMNATVKSAADGRLLGSFGKQFTITAGDPAAIVGGDITIEGLTEAVSAKKK